MSITEETLNAIHSRLQELSTEATPEQVAYLAKSFETIASRGRMIDIEQLADQKIAELQAKAVESMEVCEGEKTAQIAEINAAKESAASTISAATNSGTQTLNSLINGRKSELEAMLKSFSAVNDLPAGSTIRSEISERLKSVDFLKIGDLPFLFGVLSRYDDFSSYGVGYYTSTFYGPVYASAVHADAMLNLLTGSHNYTT